MARAIRLLALVPFLALFTGMAIAEEIPVGIVTRHVFDQSKVFPSTTRDYWVYVPRQYDPSKPTCLWVGHDGAQYSAVRMNRARDAAEAAGVLDELIARKEIPPMIGVFINPGVVKALHPDTQQDRFNRSYEYDSLGDEYPRFLLDELLPHIIAEQNLNISTHPNDRGICGNSSGGMCALNVAWERPDAFSRVYTSVGSFTDLRGGNNLASLIRKYEPRPLRIFLSDGTNDNNHYGGDWWMANQEMERALTFCGYEVNHIWGTQGHNMIDGIKNFPDAMRWLWKDWPEPVKADRGSEKLKNILIPDEGWQLVAQGYRCTEGITSNAKGDVFFNDVPARKTYRIGSDGSVSEFISDSKGGDGQRFGPDGRLYACAGGAKQIVAYDAGGKPTVIAEGFRGNDLVVTHTGGIYVTEPAWTPADEASKIWYISPSGEKRVVDTGLKFANGITISPDQAFLYVSDTKSRWIYSYLIQPDGSLTAKERLGRLEMPDTADDSGADGIRADTNGWLYVATRMGVQVVDPLGRVNCILPTPNGKIANLTFGGERNDTLYAACGDKIYRRKLKTIGAREYGLPSKPPQPGM